MKIRIERTEAQFGNEKLEKWTRVSLFKRFKKWANEHAIGLWSSAIGVLVFVAVFLGYMIYEIRSM